MSAPAGLSARVPVPALDRLPEVTALLAADAEARDRDAAFPHAGVAAVHDAGLLTATVPTRFGGPGLGLAGTTRILHALGRGDPSVALVSAMTLVVHAAQRGATAWPESAYAALLDASAHAPALVNALRVEPDLGTPARGGLPATVARRTDDGWRLSGRKIFSTGAVGLSRMVVHARTDEPTPRVGDFVVVAGSPGVTIERTWDHLGLRASRSDDVVLVDTPVAADHAVGLVPAGGARGLDPHLAVWFALVVPPIYLGVARAALDWLVGFLRARVPTALGAPLATLPRFRAAVGEIDAELTAAEDLLAALADRYDAGEAGLGPRAAGAKLVTTRAAIGAVERAVALVGNNGLTRTNPLERHLRDVLCARVHTPQDDAVAAALGATALDAKGNDVVEFVGMVGTRHVSEIRPPAGPVIDPAFLERFARAHENAGFDRVLIGYGSGDPESTQVAAYVAARTERLGLLVAHRPGFVFPTLAARTFATLDRFSGGRVAVHVITGGSDADQRREGDHLGKDERYARTDEYLQVLRRAWEEGPFDHEGRFYRLTGFASDVRPVSRIPVYFGGSSPAAYRVGGRHADVYAFWGEPLRETAEQIAAVRAAAVAAGRTTPPRISVSFRPILGPTDDAAWERAHRIVDTIRGRGSSGSFVGMTRAGGGPPQAEGSRRLLAAAARGERHDRALWTTTAALTGAAGNTTALVGSPETVAQALLDYVDIGVTTLLIRGFDPLDDAVDYGRHLLPLVRAELARRTRVPAAR